MEAVELLVAQWTTLNTALHQLGRDLTPDEWTFRVAPGQNLLGFTLWHISASQDWTVQTWVRNLTEVRDREPWAGVAGLDRLGLAFGITLAQADAIARAVSVTEMLTYADAVLAETREWLQTVTAADLGRVPDNQAHLARRAVYRTPSYRGEVQSMWTRTLAEVLALDIGHGRSHLGEARLIKELARQGLTR